MARLNTKWFSVTTILVFFVLCTLAILRHEMWRDELQAWMIARESQSLGGLFHAVLYEGTPALWHLLLYGVSRFTGDPLWMQLLNIVIMTIAIGIFFVYSPFPVWQKVLFVFGYYMVFEYGLISRSYGLSVMLIFAFCALYARQNVVLSSVALLLLAQTSAYGVIISLGLGFLLFVPMLWTAFAKRDLSWKKNRIIYLALAVYCIGLVGAYLQLRLPADFGYVGNGTSRYDWGRVEKVISTIWRSYVPVPQLQHHFWGSNILDLYPAWQLWLSFVLSGAIIFILRKKPLVLLFYVGMTIGLLLFFYVKYLGDLRHWGHLYFVLIASLWLARSSQPVHMTKRLFENVVLTFLFLANVAAGFAAVRTDWRHTFSESMETGQYIADQGLQDLPIIGEMDYIVAPLAAYVKHPVYFLRGERNGSYIFWDSKRRDAVVFPDKVAMEAKERVKETGQSSLLVTSWPISEVQQEENGIVLLHGFLDSIVGDEIYYIYLVR